MAPEELLKFITVKEIVATNDAAARKMISSASQHVEIAKALPENCNDDGESEEDPEIDS